MFSVNDKIETSSYSW